jgi:hypothetical protein
MKLTQLFLISIATLGLLGCPTRPKDDGRGPDGGGGDVADGRAQAGEGGVDLPDSGAPDADAGDTREVIVSLPTLTITSPANGVHTNGTVNIAVTLADGDTPPASISILENGATITMVSSPFQYAWDTTSVPEGTYTVVAQTTVGGRVAASAPINVVVDRTPPRVVTLTPAAGATNVVFSGPIGVTFSEPILASSLPSTAIALNAGANALPATATLSADGTAASIRITDPSSVMLPSSLGASFAATITDLAGNKLTQPITPWQWSVPDWIKAAPIPGALYALIRVDSKGFPVVAYTTQMQQGAGFAYDVHVSRYDGQSWKDLNLPTTTDVWTDGYGLDVASTGNPTAAWLEGSPNGTQVHVASYDGAKWNPFPVLDGVPAAGTNASFPVLRLDSKGLPFVVWREDTAAGNDLFVAHWNGSTWDSSFGSLGFSGVAQVYSDDLVIGPNDSPIVGWYTAAGTGVATWSTKWNLSSNSAGSGASVGVDASGRPVLVVRHGVTTVQVFTGTEWQTQPSTPVPAATNNAQSLVLGMTSAHNPVVAWLDTSSSPRNLGLAKWTGAKWDARPGLFHETGTLDIVSPALAVDSQDHMWVAWPESNQINVWMSNY